MSEHKGVSRIRMRKHKPKPEFLATRDVDIHDVRLQEIMLSALSSISHGGLSQKYRKQIRKYIQLRCVISLLVVIFDAVWATWHTAQSSSIRMMCARSKGFYLQYSFIVSFIYSFGIVFSLCAIQHSHIYSVNNTHLTWYWEQIYTRQVWML